MSFTCQQYTKWWLCTSAVSFRLNGGSFTAISLWQCYPKRQLPFDCINNSLTRRQSFLYGKQLLDTFSVSRQTQHKMQSNGSSTNDELFHAANDCYNSNKWWMLQYSVNGSPSTAQHSKAAATMFKIEQIKKRKKLTTQSHAATDHSIPLTLSLFTSLNSSHIFIIHITGTPQHNLHENG